MKTHLLLALAASLSSVVFAGPSADERGFPSDEKAFDGLGGSGDGKGNTFMDGSKHFGGSQPFGGCTMEDFDGVDMNFGTPVMGSDCSGDALTSGCYVDFFGDTTTLFDAKQDGLKIRGSWSSTWFTQGSAFLFVLNEHCDSYFGCYRPVGDTTPLNTCDEVSSNPVYQMFPLADPDVYFMSCEHYCTLTFFRCFGDSQLFTDSDTCLSTCSSYPIGTKQDTSGNTRGCRIHQLELAWPYPTEYCLDGAPDGGDTCVSQADGTSKWSAAAGVGFAVVLTLFAVKINNARKRKGFTSVASV